MYYRYFGLDGPPFSITPDPKFVYFSARHEEALAHLLFGVGQGGGGGFVQLTGEIGTGKTTLCRLLLEQLPDHVKPALILNSVLGPRELLAAICDELGVYYPQRATRKQLVDRLNACLLETHAQGHTVVLIVDEAQNLSPQALEQIRLLTNLETATDKLLQIILVGQPELRELLDKPQLRQLSQRVTARYHLLPLNAGESERYLRHRLKVAGAPRAPFNAGAFNELHRRSGGVPRLLNVIADRAMLAAYTAEADRVDGASVKRAAREVLGQERKPVRLVSFRIATASLALLLVAAAGLAFWSAQDAKPALRASSENKAWRELLGWWGVDEPSPGALSSGALSCEAARNAGLACLEARADWQTLMPLEVPVLLYLEGESPRALVITDLRQSQATRLGDATAINRKLIASQWHGGYALLVRLPKNMPAQLAAGDEGPAVAWLVNRITALDADANINGKTFDESLAAWISDFQQRTGLQATGIADAATLITLAALEAPES